MSNSLSQRHSPAPWSYDYSPYVVTESNPDGTSTERYLPAFEVVDGNYDKVFDTNEDRPDDEQEANAILASLLPDMLNTLQLFVVTAARAEECADWRWEHLDDAFAAARDILRQVGT